MVENLDEVFRGLAEEGQQHWRSYLQENPFTTILATSQSLFAGVSLRTSPFYGFFAIEHLQEFTLEDAIALLTRIAHYRGDADLAALLQTPTGRDRVQAVQHLAGNNPRVYVILSQFINYTSLDELVEPVLRTLDDLTPFYQSRMLLLSPQQRKIVDLLCEDRHPVPVGESRNAASLAIKQHRASLRPCARWATCIPSPLDASRITRSMSPCSDSVRRSRSCAASRSASSSSSSASGIRAARSSSASPHWVRTP